MTLVRRVIQPRSPSSRPPLLVLLHGLGTDEADLLPLAPRLDPRLLVVSVRAPHPMMPAGFAWYSVDFSQNPPRPDLAGVLESRDLLVQFLGQFLGEETAEHRADPERVFLFGFSQGAVLALAVALARPDIVRGVVAHSGRVLPGTVIQPPPAGLDRLDVLLLHGVDDAVIPVVHGRKSHELLGPLLGPRVGYREWPGLGHGISEGSLAAAGAWLSARIGS